MRPIPLNFQTMYADLLQTVSLADVLSIHVQDPAEDPGRFRRQKALVILVAAW